MTPRDYAAARQYIRGRAARAGAMLWLSPNTLSGSYVRLSWRSRSQFAAV